MNKMATKQFQEIHMELLNKVFSLEGILGHREYLSIEYTTNSQIGLFHYKLDGEGDNVHHTYHKNFTIYKFSETKDIEEVRNYLDKLEEESF